MIILIFLALKALIFRCLLCLGIGSGVLKFEASEDELSEDVEEVLMLDKLELLSLNLLSKEARLLDGSDFSSVMIFDPLVI